MKKIALITGVTGQDGAYLAEFLLKKNYEVHGLRRRSSLFNTERIDHIIEKSKKDKNIIFKLHYGDMTDGLSISSIINKILPDEIYNLAAQSHVAISFEQPEYTANCDALGPLRILDVIKNLRSKKEIKFYQASSSELFGFTKNLSQNEKTRFHPRSPYAVSKLYAYWITINYREAYGIFACNGILFNHESPLRGEVFVTRKITMGLSKIKLGLQDCLYLGNLDAKRDWGHAKDYVRSIWLMLQQKKADDFVIGSGKSYSVRDFVTRASKYLGMQIKWSGRGLDEFGYINDKNKSKKIIVRVDKKYFRPTDVEYLLSNSSKALKKLNWKAKISFNKLVKEMVSSDLKRAKKFY